MYKLHGTHHTRLDYVSVAPYDVKTLFGIDFGPLEMVFHLFSLPFFPSMAQKVGFSTFADFFDTMAP